MIQAPNGLTNRELVVYYDGFREGFIKGCEKSLELLVEAKSLLPPAPNNCHSLFLWYVLDVVKT